VGTLHVVATPIGNLEDVTLRALRILGEVDLVLAEDTRRTRALLTHHGIRARLRSLHAHNEAARVKEVVALLGEGRSVALVSDAGTPLVSDPGERLVARVAEAGLPVSPVPGPSALLAALSVAGLPTECFAFLGFLPRARKGRAAALERWRERPESLVLFESPRRTRATLRELAESLGDRPACVARELTKLHEEVSRGKLTELADALAEPVRGEVTIVVAGGTRAPRSVADLDAEIRRLLDEGRSVREVADTLAQVRGVSRRSVYARALELREEA
jgi:16S rRNA (cytidine1402-2'-O)-methyltransferase